MNIIIWLIIVGLAGFLATKLTGTDHKYGAVANVIIGIVGAVLGGFIANLLGLGSTVLGISGVILTFLIALAGAYLALLAFEKLKR